MHRTRWGRSKDERNEAGVAPRGAAAGAGPPSSSPAAEQRLTPAEIHAQQRSATLTAAQSRRRGVLPG
ncbi:MAG TPA: hypothetical protein VL120_12215 [Solirubrobacteraceae bacterium]|nr:hypothetical protein [Solirubrobacteraceae bacterium]